MRWLKSLIIILTFLIVSALMLIGYGFFKKSQNPNWTLTDIFLTTPKIKQNKHENPSTNPFNDILLQLSPECVIEDIHPDDNRVYLTIGPIGPCHQVVVIDIGNGVHLGRIRIDQ